MSKEPSVQIDVRQTIANIVQNHCDMADEESGFVAYDIMQALWLPDALPGRRKS